MYNSRDPTLVIVVYVANYFAVFTLFPSTYLFVYWTRENPENLRTLNFIEICSVLVRGIIVLGYVIVFHTYTRCSISNIFSVFRIRLP